MTRLAMPLVGICAAFAVLSSTLNAAESTTTDAEVVTTDVAAAVLVLEGDVAAGNKRYKRECRACHGPKAKGVSSYPKLLEHPAEYLVDRLTRYRSGEKIGPNTPLMAPRAKKLSDQNIADLTAFILSLGEPE